MKVYLVLESQLKKGEIGKPPGWDIHSVPPSLNLFQLRRFCLTQFSQKMDSSLESLDEKLIDLCHVSQLSKANLPCLILDSPAWVSGEEFLVFRLVQNSKHSVFFRMPRPLIENEEIAFPKSTLLDWVSFTYQSDKPYHYSSARIWISKMNQMLVPLFGFGITGPKDKGLFGYTDSFMLGQNWGVVATGGTAQQDTIYVSLSGRGCSMAQLGWEQRLFQFLTTVPSARLTRVDIAFDDYEGQFLTPEQARTECQKLEQGLFFTQGRAPSWQLVGDWDSQLGKKTLYVGSTSSDKRLRVYTKGRALGDPHSPWIRSELVLKHSKRFLLPFDLLTHSSQYLAAAYSTTQKPGPFHFLTHSPPASRLKLANHTLQISLEHQVRHARRASGKLINTLKQLEFSDSQIVELLRSSGTPSQLAHALSLIPNFQ